MLSFKVVSTLVALLDAKENVGNAAITVVESIIVASSIDNILLIFIFIPPTAYDILTIISFAKVIMKLTIFTTSAEKSTATNIITSIATTVPRIVIMFLPIE